MHQGMVIQKKQGSNLSTRMIQKHSQKAKNPLKYLDSQILCLKDKMIAQIVRKIA